MGNSEIEKCINDISEALLSNAINKAGSKEFYQAEIQRCLDALDGQNPDVYFSSLITLSLPKDHIYENFYLINGHKKRICDLVEGPIYGKVDYEDVDKNNIGYWFKYIQKEDKNIVFLKDPPVKTEFDQNGVKAKTRYGIHRVHIAAAIVVYIDKLKDKFFGNKLIVNQPVILKKDGTRFSLREIALIYIYTDQIITNENNEENVIKHGWNSGHKLQQCYNDFCTTNKRLRKDITIKELNNKIKLIESILEYLPSEKQLKPKDELRKLQAIYQEKIDKMDW